MLDELTPEQFNEWWAMYLAEPWGDDWRQTGEIAAEMHNAGRLIAVAASMGNMKLQESDIRKADDYIPRWRPKRRYPAGGKRLGAREAELVLRAQFGG